MTARVPHNTSLATHTHIVVHVLSNRERPTPPITLVSKIAIYDMCDQKVHRSDSIHAVVGGRSISQHPSSYIKLGFRVQYIIDDRSLHRYPIFVVGVLLPQQDRQYLDRRVEIEPLRSLPALQPSDSRAWLHSAIHISHVTKT